MALINQNDTHIIYESLELIAYSGSKARYFRIWK